MTTPETLYRDFIIEPQECLWKSSSIFYPKNGSWEENVRGADSEEEARELIDDLIETLNLK